MKPDKYRLSTYTPKVKTCTFEELKEHVSQLNEMLKEPQFGLMGWATVYADHMKAISNYWVNN